MVVDHFQAPLSSTSSRPTFFLNLCHAFGHFSGSVIKQQLVTHLTLGIALRGVLDALRKPADSKVSVIS